MARVCVMRLSVQTGYSSAPGVVQVVSYDIFSRKYEAHVVSLKILVVSRMDGCMHFSVGIVAC